ncbi:hypothetical protein AL036_14720 [Salipiger aestuarii]|nr:hypothetical protein AL036_14720 [Salipiger aestuarii]
MISTQSIAASSFRSLTASSQADGWIPNSGRRLCAAITKECKSSLPRLCRSISSHIFISSEHRPYRRSLPRFWMDLDLCASLAAPFFFLSNGRGRQAAACLEWSGWA